MAGAGCGSWRIPWIRERGQEVCIQPLALPWFVVSLDQNHYARIAFPQCADVMWGFRPRKLSTTDNPFQFKLPSVGRLVGRWDVVAPLVVVKTLNLIVVCWIAVVVWGGICVVSTFFSQILSLDYRAGRGEHKQERRKLVLNEGHLSLIYRHLKQAQNVRPEWVKMETLNQDLNKKNQDRILSALIKKKGGEAVRKSVRWVRMNCSDQVGGGKDLWACSDSLLCWECWFVMEGPHTLVALALHNSLHPWTLLAGADSRVPCWLPPFVIITSHALVTEKMRTHL